MAKKIVIIGGVAGGATAAARLRRLDEKQRSFFLSAENIFPLGIAVFPIILEKPLKNGKNGWFKR